MGRDLRDLQKKLNEVAAFMQNDASKILKTEGLKFIQQNFQDEGFHDGSLQKWQPRKTTDKRGRDITRYRTNRRGKQGTLNKYGRQIKDRPILTGHNSGGNKLRHSFKARVERQKVTFYTHKEYAQRHNEGLNGMPKRQFMGQSKTLDNNIKTKITKVLDKIFER
ncbi:phage morphogenesis protein [Ornithobacterium rhinotracheale]|uniref:Phage morphogenesis protein n=1 Tax=Ornithobacterium rhinotracheale TaxID=28251 RepID=A0A3R5UW38_ORNRH|nr:phage morphogenesis protein [Ornithobacterium rhinotracheale]QAR31131.1 phage morphogenesis protein [Ornithobacterium rhinotracheale]